MRDNKPSNKGGFHVADAVQHSAGSAVPAAVRDRLAHPGRRRHRQDQQIPQPAGDRRVPGVKMILGIRRCGIRDRLRELSRDTPGYTDPAESSLFISNVALKGNLLN